MAIDSRSDGGRNTIRAVPFQRSRLRPSGRKRSWSIWISVLVGLVVFHAITRIPLAAEPTGNSDMQTGESQASDPSSLLSGAQASSDAEEPAEHGDPVAQVLLGIALILLAAKVAGDLFERIGMPAVLGELAVGVILGNVFLLTGWSGFEFLKVLPADQLEKMHAPFYAGNILKMVAGIGVVVLLFEVGLESNVRDMLSVGTSSFLVAVLGVVAPMILGWLASAWLIPEQGWQTHLFIGATLCATSVGITARVLKDLGRSQQIESRIILGAAVIDDVLGLVVLAVVSGLIKATAGGGDFSKLTVVVIVVKAAAFLAFSILFGTKLLTRPMFWAASFLRGHGLLVSTSLVICFGFAWLANQVGLVPIVGAFAAGLILERAQYRELGEREQHELEESLHPISAILVPIFFVEMGIQVDLASFANPKIWGFAAMITVMAILGKQACAFGVREKGLNRMAVGLGMIPRGEVGLIFADFGTRLVSKGEPVIEPGTYSSVVLMVVLTTMVTPPLLKWAMTQKQGQAEDSRIDGSTTAAAKT